MKSALKLLGVGLVYGVLWFAAYSTPTSQVLLGPLTIGVFALNAWILWSSVLGNWEQPERSIGSIAFATVPTYLATLASFACAAETFGV